MRNAFVRALTAAAEADPRIVFLTGDLGFKLFDDFIRRFPGRFYNAGVAEANMAGMAAGMALEGKRPFIYSIVPFVTFRCYEQIRDDICYNGARVVVVGVGGGYSYGVNGPTHHALEDIGVMRLLPRMTVLCPGDPHETEAAVHALADVDGPAYLRLGRAGEPAVHPGPVTLTVGQSITVRDGGDATIITTGNMLATGVAAADRLRERGIACRVLSMPTVKPLDVGAVEAAADETRVLVTLEEHSLLGGLGGAVAEHLMERRGGRALRFRRLGAPDRFADECGEQSYLRAQAGLDPESVAAVVMDLLG